MPWTEVILRNKNRNRSYQVISTSDGSFLVAHVEQGRYEAIAFKEGYAQLLSLAIVIEPGQRVEDSTQFLSTLLQSLRRRLERVHSVRHATSFSRHTIARQWPPLSRPRGIS
jgi:hypothetical protein